MEVLKRIVMVEIRDFIGRSHVIWMDRGSKLLDLCGNGRMVRTLKEIKEVEEPLLLEGGGERS